MRAAAGPSRPGGSGGLFSPQLGTRQGRPGILGGRAGRVPRTGDPDVDGSLFKPGEPVIIYGEPGSGKTSLVLKILKETLAAGATAAFISTEGGPVVERMEAMGILDLEDLEVSRAYTMEHLAELVALAISRRRDLVVVDSINSLYRVEAGLGRRANEVLLGILAMLRAHSREGGWPISTAQVRGSEDIEPSGLALINFYGGVVARVSKRGGLRLLEVGGRRRFFVIDDRGISFPSPPRGQDPPAPRR